MHLVGQSRLQRAWLRHTDLRQTLAAWQAKAVRSTWNNFTELKADFPAADYVRPYTVFDIRGNRYRLITVVLYAQQVVDIQYILTNAEYDKGRWR
jgi:mRNA interferase HigB